MKLPYNIEEAFTLCVIPTERSERRDLFEKQWKYKDPSTSLGMTFRLSLPHLWAGGACALYGYAPGVMHCAL